MGSNGRNPVYHFPLITRNRQVVGQFVVEVTPARCEIRRSDMQIL